MLCISEINVNCTKTYGGRTTEEVLSDLHESNMDKQNKWSANYSDEPEVLFRLKYGRSKKKLIAATINSR